MFCLSLNEYFFYGGYPGAIALRKDGLRWARYMRDSLIETVLSKDILLLSPVSKPVLLRQTFGLAMDYPAQIVSYQKMIGSLQDAGNTTTIASYIQLLSRAFLLTAIERYSGSKIRRRGSIPKIMVFDNGLISAMSGKLFTEVLKDKIQWGRMIENAVGAQLYFLSQKTGGSLFYWRDRDYEVDYVLKVSGITIAIEVKTGKHPVAFTELHHFKKKYKNVRTAIVTPAKMSVPGIDTGLTIKEFFDNPDVILSVK